MNVTTTERALVFTFFGAISINQIATMCTEFSNPLGTSSQNSCVELVQAISPSSLLLEAT